MAGKVVNSGIVARFKLFQRWIVTRSANRHLPYCKPLWATITARQMTVFLDFESFETISSGQFYAEDISSFDSLSLSLSREQNALQTIFRVSTESFSFRQRLFNCSADSATRQFNGSRLRFFHLGGEFQRQTISTTTFGSDSTKYWRLKI